MTINWKDHITTNPKILYGKPIIIGTRIPVDLITEKLATGASFEDLLLAYPQLKKEQLLACLSYVTDLIRNEESIITTS